MKKVFKDGAASILASAAFLIGIGTNSVNAGIETEADIVRAAESVVILPEPIPDPIEPVNRFLWQVNKAVMIGVIKPTGKIYRLVVRPPVRNGIRNIGRNLEYPRNVANNLLRGHWTGARDETYRFLGNSTFGLAGFFDLATTRWGIPEHPADFGQTFRLWGWDPHVYLMLPVAGPSNERDVVGGAADNLVNPITYFPPYSYIRHGIRYNNLTESVDHYVRSIQQDFDPYYVLRYAWTINREAQEIELSFEGEQDAASLDTLQSVFFSFREPDFPERGRSDTVSMLTTGSHLPFTYWLQETNAPIVYLVPGFGSHRLGRQNLGLAELLYNQGYSVASVSSAYNYEFMERASSTDLPGYVPVDAADMLQALKQVDQQLQNKYPGRLGSKALLGYSMGAFHALQIAASENPGGSESLQFDRYVAIDPPVRLLHALETLDSYFRAALEWPSDERTENIQDIFLKVAALARDFENLTPETTIPFNTLESQFVIGLAFRLSLRDIIFFSQLRKDLNVLGRPVNRWRREPVYDEILQYSFRDYLDRFLIPYYQTRGIDLTHTETIQAATSLRAHTEALENNPRVRIITNANDILINDDDLAWFRATFPDEHVTIFQRGGHVGNLHQPAVQEAIVGALEGLH